MEPSAYQSERELQDVLKADPHLLLAEGEPELAVVYTEFEMQGVGRVDLLMVDADGRPVVVETKLAASEEVRRKVLAQALDYVADLALRTADELDAATGGRLEQALRAFAPDDDQAFEARWLACQTSLRAGAIRAVVAVDAAPAGLLRLFRFVGDRSSLDVRLLEVRKYSADEHVVYAPSILVKGGGSGAPAQSGAARESRLPEVAAAVAAFEAIWSGLGVVLGVPKRKYQQVLRPDWPRGVHYEFFWEQGAVFAELHLEAAGVAKLVPALEGQASALEGELAPSSVEWDPKWPKCGRIRVRTEPGEQPQKVAERMRRLIQLTSPIVASALDAT